MLEPASTCHVAWLIFFTLQTHHRWAEAATVMAADPWDVFGSDSDEDPSVAAVSREE